MDALSAREMGVMLSLADLKYGRPLMVLCKDCFGSFDRQKAAQLAAWAGQILINLNQFDYILKEMNESRTDGTDKTQFNYYNIYALLSSTLCQLMPTFDDTGSDFMDKMKKGIYFLNWMNEVYHLMAEKNYAGGVGQTLTLLNNAFYPNESSSLLSAGSTSFVNEKQLTDNTSFERIRKFSAFLNDVAEANGEEQLAKMIRSYALPTGSYKRKRNTWYSADLNAYAGVFAGREYAIAQYKDMPGSGVKMLYGISAPIGFSFSWGLPESSDCRKTVQRVVDDVQTWKLLPKGGSL